MKGQPAAVDENTVSFSHTALVHLYESFFFFLKTPCVSGFHESEAQISPWQPGHSGGERNGKHPFSQLSTVKGDGGEDAG